MKWREFWHGEPAIYVNAHHHVMHFEAIAKDLAALIPASDAIVLDYGCGDTTAADLLAAKCAHLYLFDGAPKIATALRQRYAAAEKISVLSEAALKTLPDASLDMTICNSIFQYLNRDECRALAAFAANKLKLGGRIVVSDVIPPHVDPVADSLALLNFAYRGGFFLAALRAFVRTFFSKYGQRRARAGLTTFTIPEMLRLLSIEGFETRRIEPNIGHHSARMTFIGKRV